MSMDYKGFEIGFFKLKDGVSDADVIRHLDIWRIT